MGLNSVELARIQNPKLIAEVKKRASYILDKIDGFYRAEEDVEHAIEEADDAEGFLDRERTTEEVEAERDRLEDYQDWLENQAQIGIFFNLRNRVHIPFNSYQLKQRPHWERFSEMLDGVLRAAREYDSNERYRERGSFGDLESLCKAAMRFVESGEKIFGEGGKK